MQEKNGTTLRREFGALSKLGFPVLVTQVGIILVSFADTMMVGRYGVDELAAAAFVNSFFMVAVVMQLGFAAGITPIVGALFGRGKKREVGAMMRAGIQTNLMMSVGFTIVWGILYLFLHRFGQPEELLPLIRPYYLIILSSLLPMAVFNCLQQVSNGITDTKLPMWIILGSDLLNVIGNYLLIFGKWGFPELGLLGAGISTLTARLSAMIAIIVVFAFSRSRSIYWRSMAIRSYRRDNRLKVWRTSYPVMIQSGVECMLWSAGAVVCGWFGKIQLASYQVVNTISQLGFMIYMSVGVALSVRVANYTGQKRISDMRISSHAGLQMTLLLATLASVAFMLFGKPLISAFTDDAEVIAAAVALIMPLILYQYGDAVQLTYVNALRGTSDVKPLLWVSVISYVIVGLPVLYFMSVTLNLKNVGVYYSFSVALITASILLFVSFRRTLRKLEN